MGLLEDLSARMNFFLIGDLVVHTMALTNSKWQKLTRTLFITSILSKISTDEPEMKAKRPSSDALLLFL